MAGERKGKIIELGRTARAAHVGYLRWQNRHVPDSVLLVLIAVVLGVLTGMSAAALKRLVRLINDSILAGVHLDRPNIRYLIWPLAGILVTSIYQRYVVRGNVASGTRIIRHDLDTRHYRLSPFTIFNSLIGCSLTMGCGASGGTEGPTALSGAAIGSCVGRWFGLSEAWLRLLVGIGGGAGIAAIFKSPIGGVLFTLEVLQMELTSLPVLALFIACILASTTAYILSDFTYDIFFIRYMPVETRTLGWVALLGVFCGLYSVYYNLTKNNAARWFSSIRNPWVGAVATGATLSMCVFMFPLLYGEGFGLITSLVNGDDVSFTASGLFATHQTPVWMFVSLGAILLLKGVLVSASFSRGGVAGDFVPTFFAGAVAGYLFAMMCNKWLSADIPPWYFSLIGMGAVMAGTIHAPLMSIFVLCETTNTYGYILPYLIAVAISYATVKVITPRSWYAETGHDDLIALLARRDTPTLRVRRQEQKQESPASVTDATPHDATSHDATPSDTAPSDATSSGAQKRR